MKSNPDFAKSTDMNKGYTDNRSSDVYDSKRFEGSHEAGSGS